MIDSAIDTAIDTAVDTVIDTVIDTLIDTAVDGYYLPAHYMVVLEFMICWSHVLKLFTVYQ